MSLTDTEQLKIMSDTVKPIIELIQSRIDGRQDALNALAIQPVDSNIPESIKKMREVEARQIRAILQEQKDILSIIKALYPQSYGENEKKQS